ncbi:MAG: phosphoribosylanthranilate isomerase [Firmicutes bacterium]|nr:phosphoribosylanthranilate isomerase [Bacillota bacterium]
MVKIKICGLTRLCDVDAINITKPDYVGFVFANSRRKVTPAQAMELRNKLTNEIIPVGVFVDETIENILQLAQNGIIETVQLHGKEDEKYIMRLKELTTVPIIKAVSVQQAGDVQKWALTAADYLLLDSKGGGTGQAFDWSLIGKVTKPYFLAGGLDVNNVVNAISQTTPFAVDVSSGVETDGLKDPGKINEFIRRARHG